MTNRLNFFQLAATAIIGILPFGVPGYAEESPEGDKLAYYVSEFTVTDPEGIKPYSAQVEASFKPFGGRFVVRGGGDIVWLEGAKQESRVVVIAFDSVERAQAWYNSPEYEKLKPIRHRAATSRVFIVEGVSD